MKKNSNSAKKASFFDQTALTILPITFDHEPEEREFRQAVAAHSTLSESQIDPKTPKDPKSTALWLAFPVDAEGHHLFFVCFPSTKDNKKCWSIGMSDKGTMEESLDVMDYKPDPNISHNPFEALKGADIEAVSLEQRFIDECPEVQRLAAMVHAGQLTDKAVEKHIKTIWEVTQGSPCRKCNRPEGCKLRINA